MAVLAALLTVLLAAQGAAMLPFEVVSIKRNVSTDPNGTLVLQPGGYFRALNFPAWYLIAFAYRTTPGRNLFDPQVIGAPEWTHSERYDINGKMNRELFDANASDPFRAPRLVQSLLAERFKLRIHREKRELSVYALTSTGKAPLKNVDVDCVRERSRCGVKFTPGHLTAGAMTMETFAGMLAPQVQQMVVNHTGLAGQYDLELEWAEDAASDKASIFTAVQEQLGLKLEPVREPVDVVVVDHLERPTED